METKFEEEQISVEVSYLLSLSNFRWSSKVVTKEPTTTTTTTRPIDSNNGCRVYNNPPFANFTFQMPHVHSHYHCLLCSSLLYTLGTILYEPAASSAALLYIITLFLTTQELLVTKLTLCCGCPTTSPS
jgi:hypothetical protein